MSFYCGAIIYNLPGLPSTGLISPPKRAFFFGNGYRKYISISEQQIIPIVDCKCLPLCIYFLLHMCYSPGSLLDVPAPSAFCFDVDYHWASSLPPVTLSAPFDVSCVHIQIEFLIRNHYHFDSLLNESSDLWHFASIIWLEEKLIEVAICARFSEFAGWLPNPEPYCVSSQKLFATQPLIFFLCLFMSFGLFFGGVDFLEVTFAHTWNI